MKKLLVICTAIATLALVSASAFAEGGKLYMKANACTNAAAASNVLTLDCDVNNFPPPGQVFGSFMVNGPVSGVVAVDGILDLRFNGETSVPAFWNFQSGGCNSSGLVLSDGRPATGCSQATNLCGAGGANCDAFITAYAPGYGGPNVARLLFTLARASTDPAPAFTNLTAHYFTFLFDIYTDPFADTCAGCSTPVSFAWNQAVFYDTNAGMGGEGTPLIIDSDDPGSDSVICINAATCDVVPTKNTTWGQLKSLYR